MSAGGGQSSSSTKSASDALSQAFSSNFQNVDASSFMNANAFGSSAQQGTAFNNATSFGKTGGTSATFVDPSQQPFQAFLRNAGQAQVGVGAGAVGAAASRGAGNINAAQTANRALFDPAAQIAAQTSSLKSGLGSLFKNEINPAIENAAIASGGFGGGRQGVAQGVAAGQLGDAFTSGLGDITARANAQAQVAIGAAPGLAEAGIGAAAAPGQFGFDQLGQFAQLVGAPTVLSAGETFGTTGSRARGGSTSTGSSVSGSSQTGGSQSVSRAQSLSQAISQSRTRARGKSKSYDFNFGWV